jgi:hypothetical protein
MRSVKPGGNLNIQPSIMVVMVPTIRKNSTKNWAAAEIVDFQDFRDRKTE